MTAIVSFIGWHDSGKTTLAAGVVAHLKRKGLRVAVIKSSDKSGISFEAPDTDTFVHRQAGADEVMLVAPDQMALLATPKKLSLTTLAHRYFPDADIVIGEGFKEARQIAKIEVVTNPEQQLRREVSGVIAVATDLDISADYVFRLNEAAEIAEFIQKRFIDNEKRRPDKTALLVNGRKIVLKGFIQDSLAGVVAGYVESLKINEELGEIELRVMTDQESADVYALSRDLERASDFFERVAVAPSGNPAGHWRAARAICAGSEPAICTATGSASRSRSSR